MVHFGVLFPFCHAARFLNKARMQLAPKKGKWWTGGKSMRDSQEYTRTFARAAFGFHLILVLKFVV